MPGRELRRRHARPFDELANIAYVGVVLGAAAKPQVFHPTSLELRFELHDGPFHEPMPELLARVSFRA